MLHGSSLLYVSIMFHSRKRRLAESAPTEETTPAVVEMSDAFYSVAVTNDLVDDVP